jgi:hypothetical protein
LLVLVVTAQSLQTFLTSLVAITDFNVSAVSLSSMPNLLNLFTLDTQAQLMITQQKSALEIEQYLVSQGQQSLWHHATELLLQGDTTLQELKRVLPPYSSSTNFNNEGKGEAK